MCRVGVAEKDMLGLRLPCPIPPLALEPQPRPGHQDASSATHHPGAAATSPSPHRCAESFTLTCPSVKLKVGQNFDWEEFRS